MVVLGYTIAYSDDFNFLTDAEDKANANDLFLILYAIILPTVKKNKPTKILCKAVTK